MGWWKDLSKDSISGVIVAFVTGSGGIAAVVWLWSYIKQFFIWFIDILLHSVSLPIWAIVILSVILLILVPTAKYLIRQKRKSENSANKGTFLDYTNDTIFGMMVSWRWIKMLGKKDYSLNSIEMRCPKCYGALSEYSNSDQYNRYMYPLIKCGFHGCDWTISHEFERVSYREMGYKLMQEIDRRCYQKYMQ